MLVSIPRLDIGAQIEPLAQRLLLDGALPAKAYLDALHLATATINGIQFLLTWNCKHLANAILWDRIERTCKAAGYRPHAICTPLELLGDAT